MGKTRVIGSRWWAVLARFVLGVPGPPFFLAGILHVTFQPGQPVPLGMIPFLLFFGIMFGFVFIFSVNGLRYRVEVDRSGLRIVGLLYTRHFTWGEITDIAPRSNFRLPGYHVGIRVDGSLAPRRHWTNMFASVTPIWWGMDLGGLALTAYLRRRWREWQRTTSAAV